MEITIPRATMIRYQHDIEDINSNSMYGTGLDNNDLFGMSFSSLDRDLDGSFVNCAVDFGGGGGWWYHSCHQANLNGPWYPEYWWNPWFPTVLAGDEIKETSMMIKPH
ncbi:fibrinogen alpha chain-like [Saccostrea cucullata]|uniref:fibrinogen alpha chain-like n=1 Tax=Saccostrea cuccullata TaxID=36930 RepID=UPI002ED2562A